MWRSTECLNAIFISGLKASYSKEISEKVRYIPFFLLLSIYLKSIPFMVSRRFQAVWWCQNERAWQRTLSLTHAKEHKRQWKTMSTWKPYIHYMGNYYLRINKNKIKRKRPISSVDSTTTNFQGIYLKYFYNTAIQI